MPNLYRNSDNCFISGIKYLKGSKFAGVEAKNSNSDYKITGSIKQGLLTISSSVPSS